MSTLVINAPDHAANADGNRSFDATFRSGIGEGYAIWRRIVEQCPPGSGVVLLCQDGGKRAEGTLEKLVPTRKAANGHQRYDVYMTGLSLVPYKPERLNHSGVGIIEAP